jgi:hypothetical protein
MIFVPRLRQSGGTEPLKEKKATHIVDNIDQPDPHHCPSDALCSITVVR